jgi:LacI family transcriptional regulator
MGKKIKNKDIAAKLGVSSTLVSLVLNNKADQHGIKKDTQERVLAMARQLGFFSSHDEQATVAPAEQKPGVIGMIVPTVSDPFITGIIPYLQKAFASIGLGFSIITKDPDDQRFERLTSAFKKFFSGLILVGDAADDSTIRTLRSSEYPFILLEKSVKTLRMSTVTTDMTFGAQLILEHISKLDYKNIIILTDRKSLKTDTGLLHEIKIALEKYEDINEPVILDIESRIIKDDIDFSELEKLLRPPFRADVIIALHASLVYPLMSFLSKRKLRVPQDIAIVSIEEGTGFDLLVSPITCLRLPLPAMATKVANMIWSEVKNSGKSKFKRQVNIKPELIVRNSCGTL